MQPNPRAPALPPFHSNLLPPPACSLPLPSLSPSSTCPPLTHPPTPTHPHLLPYSPPRSPLPPLQRRVVNLQLFYNERAPADYQPRHFADASTRDFPTFAAQPSVAKAGNVASVRARADALLACALRFWLAR